MTDIHASTDGGSAGLRFLLAAAARKRRFIDEMNSALAEDRVRVIAAVKGTRDGDVTRARGELLTALAATLCGLPVGSGKTKVMVAAAIELGQVGLVDKPMLVVPNHLLDQIGREARQLFPAALILTASAEAISSDRRAFTARAAMSPWDLIIITQSAFNAMPVHPEAMSPWDLIIITQSAFNAMPVRLEAEVSRSVAAVAAWRSAFRGQPAQPADRALAELVDRLWPDARGDAPAIS